ncbi:MAG: hypothetical protein Q4E07_02190 [Eubacteriales bacterium]|nr:hypothetical protein [Eubacteriales bacterium]
MKNKIAMLLALCLLTVSVISLAQVNKAEIVYFKLDGKGEATGAYIVNAFEADEKSDVSDFGSYQKTLNLSHVDAIKQDGDNITFSMEKGRFFYQGNLEDNTMPWEISLKYILDEKEIEPALLSGTTGDITIELNINPRAGFEQYTDNMILQGTLNFPSDRTFNLNVEGATTAYAGANISLAFIVLPGMEADYIIKAQVQDFYMPPMQLAGVSMAMDDKMIADYINKMLEGSPFQTAAENMVKNMLGTKKELPSFADARNSIESLQFVMLTDGVEEKIPPKAEIEDTETQSLWDRLVSLF